MHTDFQSEHLTSASPLNFNINLVWEAKHDLPLLARFLWCRVIWNMKTLVPLLSKVAQFQCLNRVCYSANIWPSSPNNLFEGCQNYVMILKSGKGGEEVWHNLKSSNFGVTQQWIPNLDPQFALYKLLDISESHFPHL